MGTKFARKKLETLRYHTVNPGVSISPGLNRYRVVSDRQTDGRTDGRTDIITVANTHWALRGVARKNCFHNFLMVVTVYALPHIVLSAY